MKFYKASKLHTQQIPPANLCPLFTSIHFCYIFDWLAFVSCCLQCLLMLILFCLFWTYIWNIQWRWSLYIHILCDLSSFDSKPICKKCCHIFAHHYALDDESECPMNYELSLLPNYFPNIRRVFFKLFVILFCQSICETFC